MKLFLRKTFQHINAYFLDVGLFPGRVGVVETEFAKKEEKRRKQEVLFRLRRRGNNTRINTMNVGELHGETVVREGIFRVLVDEAEFTRGEVRARIEVLNADGLVRPCVANRLTGRFSAVRNGAVVFRRNVSDSDHAREGVENFVGREFGVVVVRAVRKREVMEDILARSVERIDVCATTREFAQRHQVHGASRVHEWCATNRVLKREVDAFGEQKDNDVRIDCFLLRFVLVGRFFHSVVADRIVVRVVGSASAGEMKSVLFRFQIDVINVIDDAFRDEVFDDFDRFDFAAVVVTAEAQRVVQAVPSDGIDVSTQHRLVVDDVGCAVLFLFGVRSERFGEEFGVGDDEVGGITVE